MYRWVQIQIVVVIITSGMNSIQRLGKQPFRKANSVLNCFTGQYITGLCLGLPQRWSVHRNLFSKLWATERKEYFAQATYEDSGR